MDSGVPYEGGAYTEVNEEGTTLPDDDYLWQDYDREELPEALDWSKLEDCIRYLSEDEERRARRLLATGLFSRSQFTQYVQARLTCKYGEWYPFLRFDHALGWDDDYKKRLFSLVRGSDVKAMGRQLARACRQIRHAGRNLREKDRTAARPFRWGVRDFCTMHMARCSRTPLSLDSGPK